MTTFNARQGTQRPIRRDTAAHLFAVGQPVRLIGGFARPALASEIYHITARLPPRGDSPQYRIRNDDERHERVTTQDSLELVDITQFTDAAALMEKTFGQTPDAASAKPQPEAGDSAPAG